MGGGHVSGKLALECCNNWMSLEISCSIEVICSTVLTSSNLGSLRGKRGKMFGQGTASRAKTLPVFL